MFSWSEFDEGCEVLVALFRVVRCNQVELGGVPSLFFMKIIHVPFVSGCFSLVTPSLSNISRCESSTFVTSVENLSSKTDDKLRQKKFGSSNDNEVKAQLLPCQVDERMRNEFNRQTQN